MNAKRVSRFLSSVAISCWCLILLNAAPSWAADPPRPASGMAGDSNCRNMREMHERKAAECNALANNSPQKAPCQTQAQALYDQTIRVCTNQSFDDKPRECREAFAELGREEAKMSTSCGAAGIEGDCFAHLDKCLRCQGTDTTDPVCETLETAEPDTTGPNRPATISDFMNFGNPSAAASSTQRYAPDATRARARYKNCPALAGADLEKWMDRVKDAQQTAQEKRKAITELETRNGEIDRDLRTAVETIDEDAQKVVTEAKKVRTEMNAELQNAQKDIRNRVAQLLDGIDRIEEQIISTDKAYDDAYNAYLNALAQLDQQCHAAALNRLNAMQTQMQQMIDRSTYSVGSFNNLVGKVGVSDRKKAQVMLNRDFQRCKNDPSYKATADAAKRALDGARRAADNAKKALRERQDKMRLAIKDAGERELPEQSKRILEAATDRLAELQDKLNSLEKKKVNAINDAAQKKQENMKRIALATQEADVAEQTLKQYQAYLNEKMVASGGAPTNAGKVTEAMSALATVRAAAQTVVAACLCDGDAGAATNAGHCRRACDIVVKADSNYDSTEAITDATRASRCGHFGTRRGGAAGTNTPASGG